MKIEILTEFETPETTTPVIESALTTVDLSFFIIPVGFILFVLFWNLWKK